MKIPNTLLSLTLAALTVAAAAPTVSSVIQFRLVRSAAGADTEEMTIAKSANSRLQPGQDVLHVQKTPLLDHTALVSAGVGKDLLTGLPQIEVTFTERGRKIFAKWTRENVGKQLAIVVDGRLWCAPVIQEALDVAQASVAGAFSEQEAAELAAKINAAVKK